MATFDKINVNGVTKDVKDSGAVRFDGAQTLTDAQKQQARDNIGALSVGAGVVKYDVYQTLSDNNKIIARGNIGAASEDQVDAKADKATTVNGHPLSANVTVTKGDVGLGNVDNTSDMNKPVSTAQQAALDDKVDVSDIANNLTTTDSGKVLDARQGKVLADDVGALSAAMTYVVNGNKSIETTTIPVGAYVRLVDSTITGRSDGIYTVATAIPVDTVVDGTYFNESAPMQGGGINALNASIMLLRTKTTTYATTVSARASTVIDKGVNPDTIPGYTVIGAFAIVNHDHITCGINDVDGKHTKFNVSVYNGHSAAQDVKIKIIYVYAKS